MKIVFKNIHLLTILITILISFVLFHSSLGYYFFQDDFYHLNISKAENFSQILHFFNFQQDNISYRPVAKLFYYYSISSIFGINPLAFRIINFILFIISYLLVIKVVEKITGKMVIGFLAATLWIFSSIHFMALVWIAAIYQIIGILFFLLTTLLLFKYLEKRNLIFYILTFVSFIIAIGSFEFALTWSVIMVLFYWYVRKTPFYHVIRLFLPFLILTIIYLLLRLHYSSLLPTISEYNVALNIESLKAFFWYILWSFNIPEEFKKQIVNNILVFNPLFLRDFWPLVVKTFFGAALIIIVGLLLPIYYISKEKLKINIRLVLFSIAWFVIGISPVIILPNHTFIMYLTLASIGFYMLIAYFVILSKKMLLAILLVLIWLSSSVITLKFYDENSSMIEAQRFAKEFAYEIKRQFPVLPKNSVVFYPLADHRHIQAILNQHAIKAIYEDLSLSIYYNTEAVINDFGEFDEESLYIYQPQ